MPDHLITYGKTAVPVYRHGGTPLTGLTGVPESAFSGRENALVAAEVTVEVYGDNFLPAYTHGDNSAVVATDSIKNLVLRKTGSWTGTTLESLLHHLGGLLLARYPQMQAVRVAAEEIPFAAAGDDGVLFRRAGPERAHAELRLDRAGAAARVTGHDCGLRGLALLKLTGSAFTDFVRDDYTTLPERRDRPLYVGLDLGWRYADPQDALGGDPRRYVAAEQVRDLVGAVFGRFVSESIQHLVHEIGTTVLDRFPVLCEVSFEASNLTRDPVVDGVFTDPFPAHGTITLRLRR